MGMSAHVSCHADRGSDPTTGGFPGFPQRNRESSLSCTGGRRQILLDQPQGRTGTTVKAELVVGVGHVMLHGLLRNPQEKSDLTVGLADSNQSQHFQFALRDGPSSSE